jgi:Ca-activated chloride channel family protein
MRQFARLWIAAAGAAAAGVVVVAAGRPAPAGTQVRETRERVLYVSVVDQQGAPVGGLSPEEFVVREDGRRREAIRAEQATDPIDLTILVDTSQAMTPHLPFARDAVRHLVTALNPRAETALVTFGERPKIVVERTRELAALTRGVSRLFPVEGAGATLLDAMLEVSNGLRKREPARPVVAVVVCDGVEFTDLNADTVLARLVETGARFDVFNIIGGSAAELPDQPARERARLIADGTGRTGGLRAELISNMALQPRVVAYASELLSQYRVTYVRPDMLIPPERVEVSVTRAGLIVRGTPAASPRQ